MLIRVGEHGIGLQDLELTHSHPYFIDFSSGAMGYRHRRVSRSDELILKAVGGKHSVQGLQVLDTTAGLGRDAFVIATAGACVTMCERSVVVSRLLEDALERGRNAPGLAEVMARMTLLTMDALDFLLARSGEQSPSMDVIYLDPMFPERRKTAQVKKEMRLLQRLLAHDQPADQAREVETNRQLLELALTHARKRVVVKRPRLAPTLTGLKPGASVVGRSSRYDIYFPTQAFRMATGQHDAD